jgi:hypothetical protein
VNSAASFVTLQRAIPTPIFSISMRSSSQRYQVARVWINALPNCCRVCDAFTVRSPKVLERVLTASGLRRRWTNYI